MSAPASAPIDAVSSPVVAVNSYDNQRSADRFDENLDFAAASQTNLPGPLVRYAELQGTHASTAHHLKRGLDEGWIESVGEETGAKSPGRPSQRYRLTDSGLGAVRSEAARLRDLAALALSDDVTATANVLDV